MDLFTRAFTTETQRKPNKWNGQTVLGLYRFLVSSVSLGLCGEEKALFEDAVVELLTFPIGCGLDEGQDYGMRFLFG